MPMAIGGIVRLVWAIDPKDGMGLGPGERPYARFALSVGRVGRGGACMHRRHQSVSRPQNCALCHSPNA
jgi:hypothetical protein